ncbi:hypothetical protein [Sphingomonas nostoxanthinifaciens]|uniref:hypothetical protein n=1 Tax=Sphingomonas nostoxanthinifaciens TaxID=2872652 RepID=UPI001CC1F9BF|nr:hypothetical protein [Sphingomonas nostoxanthinifaciens]UAK23648.1 hypothetical protein K8P63_14835 [Sphingomonas nostoxanthinifaciens]
MSAGNASRNFRSSDYERAANDWYVEPRWCVEQLADAVDFDDHSIWDPCAGGGNITDVFAARGRFIIPTDIIDRGAKHFAGAWDATQFGTPAAVQPGQRVAIVTNPPFKDAEVIARRALALADRRVAILQQLSFLASKARHALFTEFPPSDVLILSKRPSMPPGHLIAELGEKAFRGGTTDFCWIVWTRPHDRETRVRWLQPHLSPTEGPQNA